MQMRTVYRNRRLWLLFGFFTALGMMCQAGHAQECAQCAKNDASEAPLSTGEWLLTKEVNEVNVLFVALHKGKHVLDLTQKDITVEDDNKAPAAILGFRPQQELPLRVAMVIDTSSSVTSRFRFEQAAASVFLRQVVNRGDDLGFVLGFSNYPNLSQDFASDPELLSQGVARLTIGGGTAIYDALRASCRKLVHHSEQDVVARVLVLLSDGQNNAGVATLESAIDAAQEAEVTIYAISTNYSGSATSEQQLAAEEGNSNLRKLAEQTGGRVLFPGDPREVAKAFAKITEELRSRYAISYKPLALIGNASGQIFAREEVSIRGVFDKEVRRKPLAFAADAWSYGI